MYRVMIATQIYFPFKIIDTYYTTGMIVFVYNNVSIYIQCKIAFLSIKCVVNKDFTGYALAKDHSNG